MKWFNIYYKLHKTLNVVVVIICIIENKCRYFSCSDVCARNSQEFISQKKTF